MRSLIRTNGTMMKTKMKGVEYESVNPNFFVKVKIIGGIIASVGGTPENKIQFLEKLFLLKILK